jgi:hypothetical protein
MNLFYDPSIIGLRQLIDTANKSLPVHNIVIDYDGEVIIDPETKFTGVGLNRFKFHTKLNHADKNNPRSLKILFEELLNAYRHNTISLDFDKKMKNVA